MARRKATAAPSEVDETYLTFRLHWLVTFCMPMSRDRFSDDEAARARYERIGGEAARVEHLPVADRVAAVEAVLAELGRLDWASRRVDHLWSARSTWSKAVTGPTQQRGQQ